MKKVLSLALALMLCIGCFTMAQAAVKDDYLGYWDLESMTMLGAITLSKEDLDYTVVINIHEDDTLLMAMDTSFAVAPVEYADGQAYMVSGEEKMPLTIDAEGLLNMPLSVDEITMDLKLARKEAPAVDAAFAPYMGEWNLDHVTLLGLTLTEEEMGAIDLKAYDDGYGVIVMDGDYMAFQLVNEGGTIKMLDSEGVYFPIVLNEQGQLSFDLESEGITMTIVMNPAGAPAAAVTETVETAPAQPAGEMSFDGNWVASTVELMGFTFTMEEMELSASLTINGSMAVLNFDGDTAVCTVKIDGNTCIINDGVTDAPCVMNENGQLCMELQAEGLTMTMVMDRQ